jgi:hypothetical protein
LKKHAGSKKQNKIYAATIGLTLTSSFIVPNFALASANTFTSVGESWINVEESSKVYFEDFGSNHDDREIFEVAAGVTCTLNSITKTGPFLSTDNANAGACGGTDPVDSSTRTGAIEIGFDVNFFGTTYSDLYINTNGGVFFDEPVNDYDESLTSFAVSYQTSLISPLSMDLYYDKDESNLWVARTTIAGKNAFVIAWEEFDACCNSDTPDSEAASFQFVFIDNGSGNFVAYFNFDKFVNINEGYTPTFDVDMRNNVTVGSNIVTVPVTHPLVTGQCIEVNASNYGPGTLTDSSWDDNANYVKLHSDTQVSVWQDAACSVPNNISVQQGSPIEYVALDLNSYDAEAVGVGWASFNSSTGAADVTEIFGNVSRDSLFNGGSAPLISYKLNTSIPGRIVIAMTGGETVTEDVTDPEVTVPKVESDKLPQFDQEGIVFGSSEGQLVLTGQRLYCTKEIMVNNAVVNFVHTPSALGDGKAALNISLPKLEPGYHELSMDSCGGHVAYARFLFIPKTPAILEGRVRSGFEQANLLIEVQRWSRIHRGDYNSVECVVNTSLRSQANALALANNMCNKAFAQLASPKGRTITLRSTSPGSGVWYRVILTTK